MKYEVVKKGSEWGLLCVASNCVLMYSKKKKTIQDRADKLNAKDRKCGTPIRL